MLRRVPRLQTVLLGCAMLLGLAAWFWWTPPDATAQDGLPTQAAVHTIAGLHQGLRVYWYEPNEDGGSPLTGYDVHYRARGAPTWTNAGHTGLSQPAVIAGLRFNTIYEVRVRARNANGAGPWSTTESRRTLPNDGRPDPPWPPTLEPGDGRIEVSWTAPAYTGARPITGYRVRYTTDDAATWRSWAPGGDRLITGTTATISGLDNGVDVGVIVSAINGRGQGRYSSPVAAAAPVQALSPPPAPSLRVMPLSRALQVSWGDINVQPPVASYELEYQSMSWNESNWPGAWTRLDDDIAPDASAYTHDELSPDRRYRYRLRARNSVGAGAWSGASPEAGAQPQPGKPALRAQTAASGSVRLSWTGGPASATLWEYRWLREDGVWGFWTRIVGSDAETTEHFASGLTEDARYDFILRVHNAAGIGPASNVASAVAGMTPSASVDRETLLYNHLDSGEGATEPGSYAFLIGAADLTRGATTYDEIGQAEALLLNKRGYTSRDYTNELSLVQVGDTFTWFPFGDCWYAFRVAAIPPEPTGFTRKLIQIQHVANEPCGFTLEQGGASAYLDEARDNVASFEWGYPPSVPAIGSDGIRILPEGYPAEGGHTYRLTGWGRPTSVLIDLPEGIRLKDQGGTWDHFGGLFVSYRDLNTGTWFWLYPLTGKHAGFWVPTSEGKTEPPRDVVARFEELVASIRRQALP